MFARSPLLSVGTERLTTIQVVRSSSYPKRIAATLSRNPKFIRAPANGTVEMFRDGSILQGHVQHHSMAGLGKQTIIIWGHHLNKFIRHPLAGWARIFREVRLYINRH
jgi:hypothetical protein